MIKSTVTPTRIGGMVVVTAIMCALPFVLSNYQIFQLTMAL